MVPAIYENGTLFVTNQRLTLEMLKEISDSGDVATRGVSVTKLFGTVDAIISKFNFSAKGKWD
jgi:hypothetical protein